MENGIRFMQMNYSYPDCILYDKAHMSVLMISKKSKISALAIMYAAQFERFCSSVNQGE